MATFTSVTSISYAKVRLKDLFILGQVQSQTKSRLRLDKAPRMTYRLVCTPTCVLCVHVLCSV